MRTVLVMTLMVRDEADVIAPMIEHAFAQGVDQMIVTDNGSVDGTRDLLSQLSASHPIEIRDDPVHRKQQHSTVTRMARDAYTEYGADWVINADADEFWFPVRPGTTLADVFARMPKEVRAVEALVWDMTGAPAREGTGFQRLVYRDARPLETIRAIGLHAHATSDMVHVGTPDVTVAQGNHRVDFDPVRLPPEELRVEVLHLPWRSWNQFERKVSQSGRAYESNPELAPSPNHHGMREYRRWKAGALLPAYIARHPDAAEVSAGIASGELVRDERLTHLVDPVPDVLFEPAETSIYASAGRYIVAQELAVAAALRAGEDRVRDLEGELARTRAELRSTHEELTRQTNRRVVRFADGIARLGHARAQG